MIRSFFRSFFLLAAILSSTAASAQIDSMMNVYAERLPSEKIHIHFDKAVYNKTETVWYKVYILQKGENGPNSKNVYLEWYDQDGKLIKQTVAPLYQSTAKGSFDIPANYKGESIHVKAYTRWMLNDDPAFSYQKELPVNTNTVKTTARPSPNKTKVEIFPEGGFLVQGLNSRVAFKATDQYGNPVLIKAVLADKNTNKEVEILNVKHDGMGDFYITPTAQDVFQLNWTDENGLSGTTAIPVTKTEGARLAVSSLNNKLAFSVQRTDAIAENFKHMIVLVHMNQVPLYKIDINASEKKLINTNVPLENLPTGLLQFTLFTSDWIPVAERIAFYNSRTHQFEATLTAPEIDLDKRKKNVVEVFVPDTLFASMSVSITDANLNPADRHTIFSDILLGSELKGKIYNPGYYFSSDADSVKEDLDLVMLTNGWRRFDWDKIKANVAPKVAYTPETEYMKIQGTVSGLKRNSEDVILNLVVSGADSSKQLIFVPVDKNGKFEQPLFFYDTSRIYYSFNNDKKLTESAKVQFNNGLLNPSPKKIQVSNNPAVSWSDSIVKSKLDVILSEQELLRKKMAETTLQEVTVTTKVKTKEQILDEKYASTGFLAGGNVAGTFDLTDPVKSMSSKNVLEYLEGKIAGLEVNAAAGRISYRGDMPEIYINDMHISDGAVEMLQSLPMIDIALVKVFRPPFMFTAGGGRGGAIAVWSKKGGDSKYPDPKGLDNVRLSGYSQFKEFYSPSYEEPAAAASGNDKRTTLYWNPYVLTDAKNQRVRIEFYNNDFTKTFQVVLEGVNEAGKMTRVVKMIDAGTKMN